VPSAGTDEPKGRELRMETGCLHRKVGTGHQTQDIKSPPEYGWHREQYDVVVMSGVKELSPAMTDTIRRTRHSTVPAPGTVKEFFPLGFISISRAVDWEAMFKDHLTEPSWVSSF